MPEKFFSPLSLRDIIHPLISFSAEQARNVPVSRHRGLNLLYKLLPSAFPFFLYILQIPPFPFVVCMMQRHERSGFTREEMQSRNIASSVIFTSISHKSLLITSNISLLYAAFSSSG